MEQINEHNLNPIIEEPIVDITSEQSYISPEVTRVSEDIKRTALPSDRFTRGTGTQFLNSLNFGAGDTREQTSFFDVGKEAFVELSDKTMIPRFSSYTHGIDNMKHLASTQTTSEKWSNGIRKAAGKVVVNVLGGTIGAVEGLINGVQLGSMSAVYNSDFNLYLEDLNKKLDYNLAHYYTEQERDMNFFQKMGTANFWANDFLGGVSFLTGTIISEGLWAAATGGTSLIAKGATGMLTRGLQRGLSKGSMAALNTVKTQGRTMIRAGAHTDVSALINAGVKANKITRGANSVRFLYTSAGFEAGVEARHYMMETTEAWEQQFETQQGRNPNAGEISEFKDTLTKSGNGLFAANVALVGASNLSILGKLFLNKAPTKALSNSVFKKTFLGIGYNKVKGQGVKAITANSFQKTFGKIYSVGKPMFTEGFIEEGGQAVFSTAASDYVLSAYDTGNVNDGLSLAESLMNGLEYAYTTKQGLTEVGLGALIGVLGGAAATRGRFNEVSSERKRFEESAEYINEFHQELLTETLKYSARVRGATIAGEQAKANGNLSAQMAADMRGMIALAERSTYFESTDETIKDFNTAIDVLDNATLIKEFGLNEEGVKAWKTSKKEQFSDVMGTHFKNLEYAEALVGGTPLAGLDKIEGLSESGIRDLKGAIAYTLTMGSKSDEFVDNLSEQIKIEIGKDLSEGQEVDAITVNNLLRKVNRKKTKRYEVTSSKLKGLEAKLNNLINAKVEAEKILQTSNKEDNTALANKVTNLQFQINEISNEVANLGTEKTTAFSALNIAQFTDEIVTEEMLDNQQKNVEELASTLETINQLDPVKGAMLKNLYDEYGRAVENAKGYMGVVHTLMNPDTRVSTLSGWLGKIINRKKVVDGDTAALFVQLIEQFQQDNQGQGRNKDFNRVTETLEANEAEIKNTDPLDEKPESIEEATEVKAVQPKPSTPKSMVEKIKARISDMIHRDPYTSLEYQGKDVNFEEVAPKQKELDRYNELLGKIRTRVSTANVLRGEYSEDFNTGLTKAELEEVQTIGRRLNNWKVLSGLNDNNDSVGELLQLINQLETEYKLTPTKISIEPIELPTAKAIEAGLSNGDLTTIITPDIAVAKKVKKGNMYKISHINATSLLRLFTGSKLYYSGKTSREDVSTMPIAKINTMQKESGTKFVLVLGDGTEIGVKIGERQELLIDINVLEDNLDKSNIQILDFGSSSFMPIFVKNGDNFVPLAGDFTITSVVDNEIIVLDFERLYELEAGTLLRTVVNLNDSFNNKLLKAYKEGKITKKELVNNINIYVSPQGSATDIVGVLRAIKPSSDLNSDAFSKLHMIRKLAVKKALATVLNKIEVGVSIPLKKVYIGSPNMTVETTGDKIVPVNNNLSQQALELVEDYGYMLNGEIFTNKKLPYSEKDVIFASKVSKRADNKNTKIPVIVFKHKNRTVVFPVSLRENLGTKASKVMDIFNDPYLSNTAKILKINEFLIENNVDHKEYKIYDFSSQDSMLEMERLVRELGETKDVANVEDWILENHNKIELLNDVQLAIDITNKPFNAPKGVMDFENIQLPNEDDIEADSVNTLDNLAKIVSKKFDKDNPFEEMKDNTAFFDAFEDTGIDMDATSYIMKKRNVNILKNAFAQNLSERIREVLGADLIKSIRAELKEYKLFTEGLKTNTTVLDNELSSEINEIKNDCK